MNWEENRELGVVRLHIFNSRISNSRKIPGPKKRELGGHTVYVNESQDLQDFQHHSKDSSSSISFWKIMQFYNSFCLKHINNNENLAYM